MSDSTKKTTIQENTKPRSWTISWEATQDEREEYFRALAQRSGVSTRYLGARWSSLQIINATQRQALNAVLQYAKGFNDMRERGVSMAWLGKPGTGKTLLASLVCMHLVRSGYCVLLVDWADVLADLRQAQRFDSDRTQKRVYEDLLHPDLLVIDEIEADMDSNARREMQRIMDKRYKEILPTILVGNLDCDEFRNSVGDRVCSRIRHGGGGIISFNWQDMRGPGKK